MSSLEDNYIIRSKRQMRALAAPTRQEIVDVLPRMGTVSEQRKVSPLLEQVGRHNCGQRDGASVSNADPAFLDWWGG
jgi:hypothetical protein